MGKSSRRAPRPSGTALADADVPVVGQREPCPCGSGKKYKACHGRARQVQQPAFVVRPFEGLPSEPDWVALREVVPAATATVRLTDELRERFGVDEVVVATVLPLAWPALRRADGRVLIGLQTGGGSGDPSRDVGAALELALSAEPGNPVSLAQVAEGGRRLQELVDVSAPFEVSVHDGFDFWVEGADELDRDVRESLEHANAAVIPTERLTGVDAAYWCRIGDRTHLRWVLPQPEDTLLDAIARLHAAGESGLGEGTRYIGAFRAHGLLVPVWDLPQDAVAADVEAPAVAFAERLQQALAVDAPLTYDERRARAGVVSRQLTLR
ncbi:DUF5926 family protein [Angustibacter sp. Root456]|uniref:DUF5926 family protein n=1 Tax=Angustibacter sp. Root456 TaxID=1736539 RepID=UPI0006F24BD2|nr:DUF5926 family protein [Angustibacter sp. Root456]KQX61795.1 topoisomerase II [Angustibacter sp. Root456]